MMKYSKFRSGVVCVIKEVLPPAIFFVVSANLVKALVRLAYAPDTLTAWKTLIFSITAVITAKAVILLDLLPFMKQMDDRPLIQPILFRSCFYFIGICLLRGIEYLLREHMDVIALINSISIEKWSRVISLNGWIFTLCFLYAFIQQINFILDGRLLQIVFVSRK